MDNIYQWI